MRPIVIKIKADSDVCLPQKISKGDWIDLCAAEDIEYDAPVVVFDHSDKTNKVMFSEGMLSLGVAMELPEGFEAVMAARSSTDKNFGVMLRNGIGVIDNSYKGDDDIWRMAWRAFRKGRIKKGDRVAQFRIQPSQHATFLQKVRWLLAKGVTLKRVKTLGNVSRGGIGSTGTTSFNK